MLGVFFDYNLRNTKPAAPSEELGKLGANLLAAPSVKLGAWRFQLGSS
jgi:hypothetical protein